MEGWSLFKNSKVRILFSLEMHIRGLVNADLREPRGPLCVKPSGV